MHDDRHKMGAERSMRGEQDASVYLGNEPLNDMPVTEPKL